MRFNQDKTNDRLSGVPLKDRVFIYNAAIIIEFLNETLMPLSFFLKPEIIVDLPSRDLDKKDFKNPEDFNEQRISMKDLYEFYKLFRQQKEYTAPIESYYKFSVIVKKVSFKRNGWRFIVRRHGRDQTVMVAPAQLRVRVPLEVRKLFPPPIVNLSEAQVETSIDDDEIPTAEHPSIEVKPDTFKDMTFAVNVQPPIPTGVTGPEEY